MALWHNTKATSTTIQEQYLETTDSLFKHFDKAKRQFPQALSSETNKKKNKAQKRLIPNMQSDDNKR